MATRRDLKTILEIIKRINYIFYEKKIHNIFYPLTLYISNVDESFE
jgi:hypothetical protein